MPDTLVDTNVLLDLATNDARWATWSEAALERCADEGYLHINPIIYAETSVAYRRIVPSRARAEGPSAAMGRQEHLDDLH